MQAIILAAGRGSRLGARTAEKPKCMTEVLGRPIIAWTLDALARAGIAPVIAVGGYRHELLPVDAEHLVVNERWRESNMVRSLLCASTRLRGKSSLVSYSDILYRASVAQALAASPADIAIVYDRQWLPLWQARFAEPLADAETFREEGGWLVEIGRRAASLDEIRGQYMGLLRFSAAGWDAVEAFLRALPPAEVDRLDMTTTLSRLLALGTRIAAVPVDGGWCEVDSESDADLYERLAAEPRSWSHDWR